MTLPLSNTGFDTNVDGWTTVGSPAVFEWVAGQAHLIADIAEAQFRQSLGTLLAGTKVTIKYKVNDAGVANFQALLSGPGQVLGTAHSEPGIYVETLTTTSTAAWYLGIKTGIGGEVYVDYVLGGPTMAGFFSILMQDYDDDNRQFTLPTTQVSAANHDAQYALAGALVTAIEGISRLSTKQWDFGARRIETGDPRPTAQAAQVNIEWQVTYQEETTLEIRTFRIGGANLELTDVLKPGSNEADLTQTEMAAFVVALEAYVVGPNGNAIEVQKVVFLE